MMRKLWPALAVLLLPTLIHAEAKMLRHPTYSKGKIAFTYLGDLWTANEDGKNAERLTDNKARDMLPRFSPDGNWIAFSSNRAGNYDVYVIPAAGGGKPRQLTFHSEDDQVVGWTPDSRKVIFVSTRGDGAFPELRTLFEVPLEGGQEAPLKTDWGAWASYSPDGSKLAFTRHPSEWNRQHYRGSYAADLWVMDVKAKTFVKLGDEDYKGNYLWPMYGHNGEIYYVADQLPNERNIKPGSPEVMQSVNNIWKIPEHGGKPVQVTHHTDGNLFYPSMSADGKTIVYEDNFGLWKLDVSSGKSTEIHVDIKSDTKDNNIQLVNITNEADGYSLSPSNRRIALSVHGEIFTIATDRGEIQRVTDTPWRDQDPKWSPDGKWIAFISDRTGREEIWLSDELGKTTKMLSDADCEKGEFEWSPDSKSMLWNCSDHKLRLATVETGEAKIIASNDVGSLDSPAFSPDGKWISYAKEDKMLRSHVFVKQLDSGMERMITSPEFLLSTGARWTADGKKLLVLGGVGTASTVGEGGPSFQLYSIALTPVDKDPNDRDINTEAQASSPAEGAAGGGRGGGFGGGRGGRGGGGGGSAARTGDAEPAGPQVKIEWDGLEHRVQLLTRGVGSVGGVVPSPDGRLYAVVVGGGGGRGGGNGPGVYTVSEDGGRLTRVSQNQAGGRGGGGGGVGEPEWSRDGRTLYFLQGGGIFAAPATGGGGGGGEAEIDIGGGGGGGRGGRGGGGGAAPTVANGPTPRRIPFTIHLQIDEEAQRRQVFEEAWRTMKYRFYDPKMNGVNWEALKDTYESILPHVTDIDEFHVLIMDMIGKLNSSHTGISGGAAVPGQTRQVGVQTRYPGFELEPDSSGYYKVSYIYHKGPADHDYVKLHVGDLILALNGKELKTTDNYWEDFNVLTGQKFDFTVNSKPTFDGSWHLALEPLSAREQDNLQYERWVDARRAIVDKASGGKIGYLHIRDMESASLRRFEQELIENLDKEALIIDVRFNGGGGIDQELLQILNQHKKYESSRARDSSDVPRPGDGFFGPMVVLQNERSASDAEMFPDGFRALGLGKVVGVPTYGAVIGTGEYELLDGSTIRTPEIGIYTATGQNMENYGVPPDVYIDNTPADFLAGRDRQVEKAVEVLQGEIK
jgi:tricorn protease